MDLGALRLEPWILQSPVVCIDHKTNWDFVLLKMGKSLWQNYFAAILLTHLQTPLPVCTALATRPKPVLFFTAVNAAIVVTDVNAAIVVTDVNAAIVVTAVNAAIVIG